MYFLITKHMENKKEFVAIIKNNGINELDLLNFFNKNKAANEEFFITKIARYEVVSNSGSFKKLIENFREAQNSTAIERLKNLNLLLSKNC